MPKLEGLRQALLAQVGHLFPWCPVAMGSGVGLFFALRFEPDWLLGALAVAGGAISLLAAQFTRRARFAFLALGLICCGFLVALLRTHAVEAPVLQYRYYGPVEGRVVALDRSASDALRLTLDQVVLLDTSPSRTPARVRVSLHGDQNHFRPIVGETVIMAAHLAPPSGPVEPGGFDFQRHAWFLSLGGVGYTRTPVMVLSPATGQLPVEQWRQSIGARVVAVLGEDIGGFATALITGDRSYVRQEYLDILRNTNLAHLLAISGLHMGLLTGVVFGGVRVGFAVFPSLSMRLPVKEIAAIAAFAAASLYLLLSGGAVATERAFIMVAVALLAILLRQRALSLRAVAIAALIVLSLTPEALLSPGFQMSFAATTALVAVFACLQGADLPKLPKWLRPVLTLVVSSAVAGAATAPFGAAHFNQMSQWGLIANLLSVPVMGTLVMPSIVFAALLAPIGLDWVGLELAGLGLSWIVWVAETVAQFPSAVRYIKAPASGVLPMLTLGGLAVALFQGRLRLVGLPVFLAGLVMWSISERPAILISDNGGLVGIMASDGRALSRERSSSFVANVWMENDGEGAAQSDAYARWQTGAFSVHHVTGKKTAAAFNDCQVGEIVVANAAVASDLPCHVIDPKFLAETGSIAIDENGQMTTARQVHGARIWNPWGRNLGKGQ